MVLSSTWLNFKFVSQTNVCYDKDLTATARPSWDLNPGGLAPESMLLAAGPCCLLKGPSTWSGAGLRASPRTLTVGAVPAHPLEILECDAQLSEERFSALLPDGAQGFFLFCCHSFQ